MQPRVRNGSAQAGAARTLSARCPACKQNGTFQLIGQDVAFIDDAIGAVTIGHRMCPKPTCRAHLFAVWVGEAFRASYPPERIDFDSSNIPATIVESLEEAITCHANQCFVAAAIMVRKTLELLCSDQKAAGVNLKERIQALRSKVVLPPDLFSGLDAIRLLGNDAAHVESEVYVKLSHEELDVAIEFTKEVLKAIYQYSALLARIQALKKVAT